MIVEIEEVQIIARKVEIADTPRNRRQLDNIKALINNNIIPKKSEIDGIIVKLSKIS
jgi:hypothetical protein